MKVESPQLIQAPELPQPGPDLRVLVVAETISLTRSGETSVPYYYLTKFLDLGIEAQALCHERVREELQSTLPPEVFARVHFVKDSFWQRKLFEISPHLPYRISDLIVNQLIYLSTQLRMRKLALKVIRKNRLNIALQPVPISPKTPSFMFGLGVPVVIGPMCGGLDLPPAFRHMDGAFVGMSVTMARAATRILHIFIPGKLRAAALIVGNQRTATALPRGTRGPIYEVVESGADVDRWPPKAYPADTSGPVRFVFCGRLVDWKGAQYLAHSFSRLARNGNVHLDIIGDGELYNWLANYIQVEKLGSFITLRGRMPLAECIDVMRNADVYVMPSLRECGGLALLEAMALGLPIVACNWMGPAEYLTDKCAILVDPDSEEALVAGFAGAMNRLAGDAVLRQQLGQNARRRVQSGYYDWNRKVTRVVEILTKTISTPAV